METLQDKLNDPRYRKRIYEQAKAAFTRYKSLYLAAKFDDWYPHTLCAHFIYCTPFCACDLPEIQALKPNPELDTSDPWFPLYDFDSRIALLAHAINLAQLEIDKL